MKTLAISMILLISVALTSCGGAGGNSNNDNGTNNGSTTFPTKAVVKLSTGGSLPSGAQIGGIDVTVTLPQGVTLKSTTSLTTDDGVVMASGAATNNTQVLATYSAATGTAPGHVRILIANPNGFGIGEFATVNGEIASGATVLQAGFGISDLTAKDLNGVTMSGLSSSLTLSLQ
jgi:hypothetical protein